jgi:IS30 family transposase
MPARRTTQSKTGAQGKTAQRARYVELARQGLSNGEICHILGIVRRTGTKWRYGYRLRDAETGRVHSYPPMADFNRPMFSSPRLLSEEERIRIADLVRAGKSIRAVAASLGRAPSTISRELRRNPPTPGRYTPHRAHQQARQRRFRSRPGEIGATPLLREQIQELMKRRWSPEQISRHLKTTFPDDESMHAVPETIYQDLYNWQGGSLAREFCRLLRRRHLHRKPSRRSLNVAPGSPAMSS